MIITYDKCDTTNVFSDGDLEDGVNKLVELGEDFTLCQELAVEFCRVLVIRGVLDPENFIFRYVGEMHGVAGFEYDMVVNDSGRIDEWPYGFCDQNQNYLSEILSFRGKNEIN